MSQGADKVVAKLNQLLDVNRQILSSLEKGRKTSGEKTTEKGEKGEGLGVSASDVKVVGGLASSVDMLVNASNKFKEGAGKKLTNFIQSVTDTVKQAVKDLDQDKIDNFTKLIKEISTSSTEFMKGMALNAVLAPLAIVGSYAFALSVKGIVNVLSNAKKMEKDTADGIAVIISLGSGIAKFGLTMVAFAIASPLIAVGALAFVTVILGLSFGLKLVDKLVGNKPGFDQGPLGSLLKMGRSIAMFGLGLVAFAIASPLIAIGAIAFITVILGISLALKLVDKIAGGDSSPKGKNSLANLAKLTLGIAAFSLMAILIGSFFLQPFALGAMALILALGALSLVLIPYGMLRMQQAAKNLLVVSAAMAVFSVALVIYGKYAAPYLTWENLAMLGAAIAGVSLIATVLGIPKIAGMATKGAIALILLSGSLVVFAGALAIYAQLAAPKLTWENLAMLGAVILGLGLAAAGIGIPAVFPFVMLGAVAMIALSASLLVVTSALSIFAASKFNQTDGDNLKYALHSIILGYLGYNSFDDMGITAVAAVPARAAGMMLMGASFVVAAASLLPLSVSLRIFKATKWTAADSDNLKYVLSTIAGTFADIASGGRWELTQKGIFGLKDVGNALSGLATGIQAMANMTFTEYVWDEATKKLQPKNKVPLTEDDVKKAVNNTKYILTALAEPLAQFGAYVTGAEPTFGPDGKKINANWKTTMQGIASMGGLGQGLANIAKGVGDWVNLGYWEYKMVYNPKTKMEELKPVNKKTLGEPEITAATNNIKAVLKALVEPLAEWGKMMGDSGGSFASFFGFGKNDVEKGIASMAQVGTGISTIADSVLKFATLSFQQYKTVDGKLVPDGAPTKLSPTDITNATNRVSEVLIAGARGIANAQAELDRLGGVSVDEIFSTINSIFNNAVIVYGKIAKGFHNGELLSTVMKNYVYFFETIKKAKALEDYMTPLSIARYDAFVRLTERLAKISSPFERFTKAFADMSKNMAIFSTNFKVMNPESIKVFKEWTDAMVTFSKVDIKESGGIIDFVNDAVSSAFDFSGRLSGKTPQDYTEAEKVSQLEKGAAMKAAAAPAAAPAVSATPAEPQMIKIDEVALASAISTALRNITVETIKANRIIQD